MRTKNSLLAASFIAVAALLVGAAQDSAPPTVPTTPEGGGKFAGRQRRGDHPGRQGKENGVEVGQAAPAFTLTGVDGKTYTLADFKGKTVILEWFSPYCPVSAGGDGSYWGTGNASKVVTSVKAADSDAVYLTINSNKDDLNGKSTAQNGADSTAAITKAGQSVPVLLDTAGTVGHAYGARTTPHVFIVDAKGNIAYIGAPMSDDGKTDHITNAVTALKAGKPVEPSTTKNKGCGIKYAPPTAKSETPPAPTT